MGDARGGICCRQGSPASDYLLLAEGKKPPLMGEAFAVWRSLLGDGGFGCGLHLRLWCGRLAASKQRPKVCANGIAGGTVVLFREPWLRIQTRSRAMSGGFLLWLDLCPPRPLSRSNLATSRRGHSSLGLRNWNDLLLSLDFCPSSSLSRCDASAPFCRQFATRFGASSASIYSSESRKCRIQSG
jgi:hypothetical protein